MADNNSDPWDLYFFSMTLYRYLKYHLLYGLLSTVKPVYYSHLWELVKVTFIQRWPLHKGSLFLKIYILVIGSFVLYVNNYTILHVHTSNQNSSISIHSRKTKLYQNLNSLINSFGGRQSHINAWKFFLFLFEWP